MVNHQADSLILSPLRASRKGEREEAKDDDEQDDFYRSPLVLEVREALLHLCDDPPGATKTMKMMKTTKATKKAKSKQESSP